MAHAGEVVKPTPPKEDANPRDHAGFRGPVRPGTFSDPLPPGVITEMLIGLISDTHGLLRPEVFDTFQGVDHILHAGDIGGAEILIELGAIAPVTAVWGNTDGPEVRGQVPEVGELLLSGLSVTVVHGHQYGAPTGPVLAAAYPDADLVVFGHSHKPEICRVGRGLIVNPGSAGAVRFRMPATVAIATVSSDRITARSIELLPR